MLDIDINLQNFELDANALIKDLYVVLDEQNKMAAREWLKAVILRVPVFTGEARGSLLPLANFLNESIPIHPVAQKKGHSIASGAAQSSFEFTNGPIFDFIFTEDVAHYKINEYYDVNPPIHLTHLPRPWASFLVGKEAYKNYIERYLVANLPVIKDYLIVRSSGR